MVERQQSLAHTPVPNAQPNLLLQAVALQEKGQMDEACVLLRRCLAQNPRDPLALYAMGSILTKHNDLFVALDFLTQAVHQVTKYAPLWFAHGYALARSGRLEDALKSYDEALLIDPGSIAALRNSAIVLRDLQRIPEAMERFGKLVELEGRASLAAQ